MIRIERERCRDNNETPITLAEAAEFLNVCRQTLAKRAKSGDVPCVIIGRQYRFFKSALKQFCLEKESNET